ncbi:MAG TPA: prolipoprotein diacylglyceryl transferase family protein [Edaphobacter sp.]|nr:prolipoprotein diacylglyceryl transferase family protein [Edaphobacter sp.]
MHPILFHFGPLLIPSYGALAALGVLLALIMAQRTARAVSVQPQHVWNLCVIALCAALVGARLLLVIVNWRDLVKHPLWMLGLAMIHHPLLAAAGVLIGAIAGLVYARWQGMPLRSTLDALAAPIAVGFACEQAGALLAGSGYGIEASVRWAITYTSPLAARWSGAPLGVAVHPVQAYAGIAYATIALFLLVLMPVRAQEGDIAGIGLLSGGIALYVTEFWRDPEGRGLLLNGAIDGPQIAAVVLVIAGALLLIERKRMRMPHA